MSVSEPLFVRNTVTTVAMVCALASATVANVFAQTTNSVPVPTTIAIAPIAGLEWTDLTPVQQQSLKPLEKSWAGMAAGHRRKWIALSKNYPQLGAAEQAKMHDRMEEWAALKPKARELARLNFAEVKKVAPEQRAANWEAYQALSPEEKSTLAKKTPIKPTGAAVSTKPVPASKLTPVPVTRHSPDANRTRLTAQQAIDPNTLLPIKTPSN